MTEAQKDLGLALAGEIQTTPESLSPQHLLRHENLAISAVSEEHAQSLTFENMQEIGLKIELGIIAEVAASRPDADELDQGNILDSAMRVLGLDPHERQEDGEQREPRIDNLAVVFNSIFDDKNNLMSTNDNQDARSVNLSPVTLKINPETLNYDRHLSPISGLGVIYGNRAIAERGSTKVDHMEILAFDALEKLHEKLQADVLTGENGLIPRVVTPPDLENSLAITNNTLWLEKIA